MGESGEVRAPVAALRLVHDDRSMLGRDLGGAAGRAVVDDDDLAGAAERLERLNGLVDDAADRGFLVQAGQDDRDLHRRRKITALTAVEPNSIRAVPRSGTAAPLPRCADDLSPRAIAVRLFGDASR